MLDMDRARLTERVYRLLSDPTFRRRLTATAPDGSHPVVVVTREDAVSSMLSRLDAVGGSGNVVVPDPAGLVVLAMDAIMPLRKGSKGVLNLTTDCTVGVLVERMRMEMPHGGLNLKFAVKGDSATERGGHAEMVALRG